MSDGSGVDHLLDVERFWIPVGSRLRATTDGWAPESMTYVSEAVSTRDLAASRCLVLLGEPGMGKSSTLAASEDLRGRGEGVVSFSVDLAHATSEEGIRRTFESTRFLAWHNGQSIAYLTLDSFDEAQTRIGNVHLLLNEYLKEWDTGRLRLRIACRTADWPASFNRLLGNHLGDIDCFELMPLRRADAEILAAPLVDDPTRFLDSVDAARVAPLAARPLTLRLLSRIYARDGHLSTRTSQLYEQGLLALCDEIDEARRDAAPASNLGPRKLLDLACRTAALSLFMGRLTISSRAVGAADPADLTLDDIVRIARPGDPHPDISRPAVLEMLRTGLFAGSDTGRFAWAHATFADYLAARWVDQNELDEPQIRSLLVTADGYIFPGSRQLAAWLVAIAPGRHGWLVRVDPEAFLVNSDIPDDTLRQRVTAAVLELAALSRLDPRTSRDFRGINHPALTEQLNQVLAAVDMSDQLFDAVISIGRQCRLTGLMVEFVRLALDGDAPHDRRVVAAVAVADLSDDNPSEMLVPLAMVSATRSSDASPRALVEAVDLHDAALDASFPHAMTTREVLACLAPTGLPEMYSAYSRIVRKLSTALNVEDLSAASEWLAEHPEVVNDPHFERLIDAITTVAIRDLTGSASHVILRRIAFARSDAYKPLFGEPGFGREQHLLSLEERRELAAVLFGEASEEQMFGLMANFVNDGEPLIPPSELEWLIEKYCGAAGSDRDNFATAIGQTFSFANRAHIDLVLDLDDDHPAVSLFASYREPVRLDTPEVEARRQRWRSVRDRMSSGESDAEADVEVDGEIARLVIRAASGDTDAFWQAARFVTVLPGTRQYTHEFQPDLSQHPRWQQLAPETREDIVKSCVPYLTAAKCEPDRWLTEKIRFHPAEAGYRALTLLLRCETQALEELPNTVWREWAPIIVEWPESSDAARGDDKQRLFELALPYARRELTAALLQLIDKRLEDKEHTFLRSEIALLDSDVLVKSLIDRLEVSAPSAATNDLLDFLGEKHCADVWPLLSRWVDESGDDRDRAIDAAARMFLTDASATWTTVVRFMTEDPEWLCEVFLSAIQRNSYYQTNLDTPELARLYVWLFEKLPPENTFHLGARFLTAYDQVDRWRNTLLQSIVEAGTNQSVAATRWIADALPGQSGLRSAVIIAEHAHREKEWKPVSADELDQLAADRTRRLVRTPEELFAATLAALEQIQSQLQGDTPEAQFLWDTHSKRPKTEDEVSDYIRNRLQTLMHDRSAVINREVQVRRGFAGVPERTDIRVDAYANEGGNTSGTHLTLVAEVKGCWHREVLTAWRTQLLDRYMADLHTDRGIYLVVWFDQASWKDTGDPRRTAAIKHESRYRLRQQIEARISEAALQDRVEVVVLDASFGRPSTGDGIEDSDRRHADG